MSELRKAQFAMADFLRNPRSAPAPEGVEPRRLKVYQDLVYNNIEGFISSGFPVLRSIYDDDNWHRLVGEFIDGHRCHTPYFLEISQEFLRFLSEDYQLLDCDPPFLAELAHYEWVELALDVSGQTLDILAEPTAPLKEVLELSPLAWLLSYRFPVHQIGPGYQPAEEGEPTFLVVYRKRDDTVCFMALNAATARLLELVRDTAGATGEALLAQLAKEFTLSTETVLGFGSDLLLELAGQSIIGTPAR